MLVVALTQRGGQEKGKGHRSEGKTGDPGGGEGAPSAEFQLGGLATPTTSWSLDCSMGHAWGTGWRSGEEALAKQGCEAGGGGPLRGCEDRCHSVAGRQGKAEDLWGRGGGGVEEVSGSL